ncbi:ATP-binding protein [Microcoleus sp. FACHB-672]|uniref:ATP-binding protein n=1 Tax=Microcoleus sp. FACHB-672 TaxID=2692825 RepID=UPI0016889D19|nr:ATP-binding protein [Microcoleus sp. FACHB-672]MBD2039509.1 ATP-binding protein [Microcoleus sp. FACHB-672]
MVGQLPQPNQNQAQEYNQEQTQESNPSQNTIGRVAATKMQGNNSREFYFWIDPSTNINPLDLIVVREQQTHRQVYAQVLDITSYTDAESFLEIFASTNFGDVQLTSEIDRIAFNVAKAQVLGTSDNVRMPVQFNSPVYLADAEAIQALLRANDIREEYRIPIGYIEQSNNVKVPVCMEASWLTGPEGAHLNVSGKSRLAAKTSYILFLISAILQTQKDTAFVIFNVKGSDLLQIHRPNRLLSAANNPAQFEQLEEDQRERLRNLQESWQSMGLEARPFDENSVFYFLPSSKNDSNRINADLRNLPLAGDGLITNQPNNYFIYRYTLQDVQGKLRLLLASQPLTDPQEQLIDALDNDNTSYAWTQRTFSDLSSQLQTHVAKKSSYLNATDSTVRVVMKSLNTATNNRTTGVFDYERQDFASNRFRLPSTFIKDSLTAGQTVVVDIGSVNDLEKQWVFGDVLKAVEDKMAFGDTGELKKIVIFVDELNKYAPSGLSSPLTTDIVDITARGGSLGVILFGAEQFASRINPQVYGNCANKAFGLTDATETSTDPYRAFPKEIKDRLSELQKGELILNVDFFGQPLRVKFPPPACRKQEDAS